MENVQFFYDSYGMSDLGLHLFFPFHFSSCYLLLEISELYQLTDFCLKTDGCCQLHSSTSTCSTVAYAVAVSRLMPVCLILPLPARFLNAVQATPYCFIFLQSDKFCICTGWKVYFRCLFLEHYFIIDGVYIVF